jgi:hypothetical protein
MVQYVSTGTNSPPVKKQPYFASSSEWAYLSNYLYHLEPTNFSRKHIIRGADWIESTLLDCRRYLHVMFMQYHCSGQNDKDKDAWGSQTEYKHWVCMAHWKNAGSNSVLQYTKAMINSVTILDLCDFQSIICKMPHGQGVDGTVNDGTVAPKHRIKKRATSHKEKKKISLRSALYLLLKQLMQENQRLKL